jgi:hypothetical protein
MCDIQNDYNLQTMSLTSWYSRPRMTRSASYCGLVVGLLGSACAGQTPPSGTGTTASAEACSSVTQPGVSSATAERLERASNVLDYETIWRAEKPGTAQGTIGGSEVRARIRANAGQIRGCYESALDKLPEGAGRVVVRFVIDAGGHVPAVSVSSNDFQAPEVGCCVAKHVAQWTFPTPSNGGFVVVEYPFVVRTSKSK